MITFIRKMVPILCLLASTAYSYDEESNVSNCGYTESASVCCPSMCERDFVSADLLYWRAFQSGLGTCVPIEVSDTITSGGRVISRLRGRGRDLHFNWNPGLRIGIGTTLGCGWNIASFWTHFSTNAHGSRNYENELRWKISYDTVDLVMGYRLGGGICFKLSAFGGLRGSQIEQKLYTHPLFNSMSSSLTSFPSSTSHLNIFSAGDSIGVEKSQKENFLGLGPLIGLAADWDLGCGLNLYANGSVAWLYSRFNLKLNEIDEGVDTVNICNIKTRLSGNLFSTNFGFGIRWKACLCNSMFLLLQLGAEHQRYFDYNRLGNYGDLSFDGANFSATLIF